MAVSGQDKSTSLEAIKIQMSLANKCVANTMRCRGLAQYEPDPGSTQHHYRPSEGQWAFGASGAKFTFQHNEFPAYDIAVARLRAHLDGGIVLPLSDAELQVFESFYEQALLELSSVVEQ